MHEANALPFHFDVAAAGETKGELAGNIANETGEVIFALGAALHLKAATKDDVSPKVVAEISLHYAEHGHAILLIHLQRIRKVTMRRFLAWITQRHIKLAWRKLVEHSIQTMLSSTSKLRQKRHFALSKYLTAREQSNHEQNRQEGTSR